MTKHTPSACLSSITITAAHLEGIATLEDEFKIIKRVYHEKILKEHPDKGGDPATFRETRAAFEVLRSLYHEGSVLNDTFSSYLDGTVKDDIDVDELFETYASSDSYPSYSYYAEAAATETPSYRVEKAKSGRSSCKSKTGKQTCDGVILKDSIRVGSLVENAGSYSRWHHLTSAETRGVGGSCKGWRVPKKVWSGLTNPSNLKQSLVDLLMMEEVLLCGLASLDGASQQEFARHCTDESNWAQYKRKATDDEKKTKKKSKTETTSDARELVVAGASSSEEDAEEEDQKPAAQASSGFSLANPDSADTADSTFLKALSFVISGSFPELVITGATKAKDAGVGDVKVLIESFGGKVTSRFSKNTNYLIVGKDTSRQRFADSETRKVPVLTLNMLNAVLSGRHSFADVESLPAISIESLEGAAYQKGGGPLPDVIPTPVASAPEKPAATRRTKKPAANDDDKNPAAKKGNKKKEKKVKHPSDPASVALAAVAAAEASKKARRAIEAAPSSAAHSVVCASANSNSNALVAAAAASSTSTALTTGGAKARFVIPKPGVNGAVSGVLNGKRFVLTGVFPEVGGGSGLNLGKDRMINIIESFGGKVTGSVSGKTDYVVVGRSPGASKVGKAHQNGITMLDILSLERLIYGRVQHDQIANEPPPRIESFSAGYRGNGLLTRGEY